MLKQIESTVPKVELVVNCSFIRIHQNIVGAQTECSQKECEVCFWIGTISDAFTTIHRHSVLMNGQNIIVAKGQCPWKQIVFYKIVYFAWMFWKTSGRVLSELWIFFSEKIDCIISLPLVKVRHFFNKKPNQQAQNSLNSALPNCGWEDLSQP